MCHTIDLFRWPVEMPGRCPFGHRCSHGDMDQPSNRGLRSQLDGGLFVSLTQSRFGQKPLLNDQHAEVKM